MHEELRLRLAQADTVEGAMEGLLFHGTSEPFDDRLKPGAFDNVLWTAETAAVAQTYIPRSGISLLGAAPERYVLEQRPRPAEGSFWYQIVRAMGHEAVDVERDAFGDVRSWVIPDGYPTYHECVAWLEGQGYQPRRGVYEVSTEFVDGKDLLRPADWRKQGRLFVAVNPGLTLMDLASGRDSDLSDPDHLKVDLMRRIEDQGFDGVIINDFLQSKAHGNVGHRSLGLFAVAADRIEWSELAATNFDWDEDRIQDSATPEFEAAWSEARAAAAAPAL